MSAYCEDEAATVETVTYELHLLGPDGSEGPARFFSTPLTYETQERCEADADRFASEQDGWSKPMAERKAFFAVEVTTRTLTTRTNLASTAEPGQTFETVTSTVTRRLLRQGESYIAAENVDEYLDA